jgi:hypothetical protein
MANTTVHVTTLATNAATADPAGTAIVAGNTHVITPTGSMTKVALRLTNTFAGSKVFTVVAGHNPPAQSAGQGNLDLTLTIGSVTPYVTWVVLESARFVQADNTIHVTVAASTTGFIEAFQLP